MTNNPSTGAGARPLDFGSPLTPTSDRQAACANCTAALRSTYHMLGEHMICGKCRAGFEGTLVGGSGANRFGRALLFGTGAAAVGAAIYYAILATTGYSIGLLAILVGYMVGRAVNVGSHRKGGRKYQLLAAFLTYFAMSSTYIVDGVRQIDDEVRKPVGTSEATTDTIIDDDSPAPSAGGAVRPESITTSGDSSAAGMAGIARPSGARGRYDGKNVAFALTALVAVVLVAPIIAGFSSPILLLILGFGVYQAWKMNRGVVLALSGPFQLKPPASSEAA
jgi:hypothetical protein